MSKRICYEFQYFSHADTWQSGSFEDDEKKARKHYKAMVKRFPCSKYRLIKRTTVEEVIEP